MKNRNGEKEQAKGVGGIEQAGKELAVNNEWERTRGKQLAGNNCQK
jgi:hypothetical protein